MKSTGTIVKAPSKRPNGPLTMAGSGHICAHDNPVNHYRTAASMVVHLRKEMPPMLGKDILGEFQFTLRECIQTFLTLPERPSRNNTDLVPINILKILHGGWQKR